MECMTSWHQQFLYFFCLPVIIIWLLVFPIKIVYYLYKNKNQLGDKNFQMVYGFIYIEYQYEFYFWEIFKIYLKIMIAFTSSLKMLGTISQGLIIIGIFGLYMFMIVRYKPYKNKSTNYIDFYNCFLCQMMIALSIMLQISDSSIKYIILGCFCGYMYLLVRFYDIVFRFMFKDLYFKFMGSIDSVYKKIEKMDDFVKKAASCMLKKQIRTKLVQQKFYKLVYQVIVDNQDNIQHKKAIKYYLYDYRDIQIGSFDRSCRNKNNGIEGSSLDLENGQRNSSVDIVSCQDSDLIEQQSIQEMKDNNIEYYLESGSNFRSS